MPVHATYDVYKSMDDWGTPAKYVNAAREVMSGEITLDPASCEIANQVVRATVYYDKAMNGLAQPWFGNVWLNPPYGKTGYKSNQELWTSKLIAEYRKGTVKQALTLVNAGDPATAWYQRLCYYPVCLTDHRIMFYRYIAYKGGKDRAMTGSAIFYLGSEVELFFEIFSQFGRCMQPVKSRLPIPLFKE